MRRMAWMGLACLAGCQSVEIEYKQAPSGVDANRAALADLATQGYEFVAPARTVIVVAPLEVLGLASTSQKGGPSSPAGAGSGSGSGTGTGGSTGGGAKGADPAASVATSVAAGRGTGKAGKQVKAKAVSPKTAASAAPAKGAAAAGTDSAASGAAGGSGAGKGGGSADVGPTPDPLGEAYISQKTWAAVAVPVADYQHAFFVHGVSGFWKGTTLAISRYPDTDRVSAVASTAENFTAKRIESAASIATAVIGIAGLAVSDDAHALEPFKLELPATSVTKWTGFGQSQWAYKLEYPDGDVPVGTVSFKTDSLPAGKVNYWPVSACQVAKLTLSHQEDQFVFYVTVAAPGRYRLQPLPVSGKLDLGSVCGGSLSGVTQVDPLGPATDIAAALQQAVKKVKDAKTPPAASAASQPAAKGTGKSGG